MTVTLKDLAKILDEDDIIEILDYDGDWVEFEDWDAVEVGRGEDWDGTTVYDDEFFYNAEICYKGNNKFEIHFNFDAEWFDDEDEVIDYITECYE